MSHEKIKNYSLVPIFWYMFCGTTNFFKKLFKNNIFQFFANFAKVGGTTVIVTVTVKGLFVADNPGWLLLATESMCVAEACVVTSGRADLFSDTNCHSLVYSVFTSKGEQIGQSRQKSPPTMLTSRHGERQTIKPWCNTDG